MGPIARPLQVLQDHQVNCSWLQDALQELLATHLPEYITMEMPDAGTPTVTFKVHPEWQRIAKEVGYC